MYQIIFHSKNPETTVEPTIIETRYFTDDPEAWKLIKLMKELKAKYLACYSKKHDNDHEFLRFEFTISLEHQ